MIEVQKSEYATVYIFQKTKKGNTLSGDNYVLIEGDHHVVCAVIDGLGSGEHAHSSSLSVAKVIKENHDKSVKEMMEKCNEQLVAKRGVVLTVVKFDCKKHLVHYSSVGNISFIFFPKQGKTIRPIPNRGFLSGRKCQVKTEQFSYEAGCHFIIFSDGVKLGRIGQSLFDFNSKEKVQQFIHSYVQSTEDDMTLLVGQLH